MMSQYLTIKKDYPDAILLFRMGDFYETFYEDAMAASKVLGIALTSRSREGERRIPLAGVPHHAVDTYVARLVRAGYKVAICDQVEDPKEAKGLVKRRVVEVVTPGTVTSSLLLDEKENNYLVSLFGQGDLWGMARADLSTGEFAICEVSTQDLYSEIAKTRPREVVYPRGGLSETVIGRVRQILPEVALTPLEDWLFLHEAARDILLDHFRVASLDGFGCQGMHLAVGAAGGLVSYLRQTQRRVLPHMSGLSIHRHASFMEVDEASLANLEILSPLNRDDRGASLVGVLDRTLTSMGGRLLKAWIRNPLVAREAIVERLEAVDDMVSDELRRKELRATLRRIDDLERLIARVCCDKAGPRDLLSLRDSLGVLPGIGRILDGSTASALVQAAGRLPNLKPVVDLISRAVEDDAPVSLKPGEVIREGFDARLDETRQASGGARKWILDLQTSERVRTGIASLRVGYNKVFGYYIEVSKAHLRNVPSDYTRKQTLVGGERFVTDDLKRKEAEIVQAEERAAALEEEIFQKTRSRIAEATGEIQAAARVIAELDVLASFAEIAHANNYVRPVVASDLKIEVRGGRHPVVERFLGDEEFVPNDVFLDGQNQILVITGPNMAGKSTFIRQTALIVMMAQIGSFVPAASASVGIVDKIFTRIGATDRVARGQSTFLVEMIETANILNNATQRSLVLLDEVGRGTSTFDGLSIAWAVVEYLHNNDRTRPLTLFATHYHELTDLARILPRVKNFNVLVREYGDRVIFLRKIVEGGSDRSYGIHVAKLAGLPGAVIERAAEILANLEEDEYSVGEVPRIARGEHSPVAGDLQLSLWDAEREISRRLAELDPDRLTPLEALNQLQALRKMALRKEKEPREQDQDP